MPPSSNPNAIESVADVVEPSQVASWAHLGLVYVLFIRFLESSDFQPFIGRQFITKRFIMQLFDLFDSEDSHERQLLKIVLMLIYNRFLQKRGFIRQQINNVFFR